MGPETTDWKHFLNPGCVCFVQGDDGGRAGGAGYALLGRFGI